MDATAKLLRDLGRRIRERRTARGWSLDRLAGEAGISKVWLWELERAKGVPGIVVVAAIARALECAIDTLVFGGVDAQREEWLRRAVAALRRELG